MTDCCLFVCMRPRTFQRLIKEIYRHHYQSRNDEFISPSQSKIRRLVEYAATYPNKLRLITNKLNSTFVQSFTSGSIGFTLLTIEIYRHMLHQFYHLQLTYLLEPHINFLLLECILSRKVVYLREAAVLIKDCVKYHAFSTNLSFLSSVLDLCDMMHEDQGQSQENRTYSFIGFTILISLLKVLHHFPSWMESYFDRICGTIHRGILACSATRFRGDTSTRNRENSVAALLHSRSLYIQIVKFLPRTLEDLCWKALQSLCATQSISTIHAIVNVMCLSFERSKIKIASKLSIQTLTMITMSYESYSGQEYLLENALLDYVVYRLNEGKGSRKTVSTQHDAQDNDEHSMSQQRQYYFLHFGSEERIRQEQERLHLLCDVIDVLHVWRENETILNNQQRISAFSLESFIYIVKSLLEIISYLIIQYPFLLSKNMFPSLETRNQPLSSIIQSIRGLPTKLKNPEVSTDSSLISPAAENMENTTDSNNSPSEKSVILLMHSLYELAKVLSTTCTPLGTNFALLWDQTLTCMVHVEERRFMGTYQNNKCISMFRVHGLYLSQILLQSVPISVPSIQLSALVSSTGSGKYAASQGQTLVSDQSWDILHRWLVESGHWEELRHVMLVMLKVFGAAEPAIRQLLHGVSAATNTASTVSESDALAPVLQAMVSSDAASTRQQFTFFPFSLRHLHFLQSILFEHMEVPGRGLTAVRVIGWSRMMQLWLRLYGEYAMLLSLPMILTLLQEAEHVWRDEVPVENATGAEETMAATQENNNEPHQSVVDTAEKRLRQRQREEQQHHRGYLLMFIVHYFHLIARSFQISSLFTVLKTWFDQLPDKESIFPSSLILDFDLGTLELNTEMFLQEYHDYVQQQRKPESSVTQHDAIDTTSPPLLYTNSIIVPLNTADILKKLVAHGRFQPLTLHISRAFEQPFVPFSEEYVSDLVETSSVFGARTPTVRSRAASFAARQSITQAPEGLDAATPVTRSRANSRTSVTSHRTPGKILSQLSSHSLTSQHAHMLLSNGELVGKAPGTRSVASQHTTSHTVKSNATTSAQQVKTTIHQQSGSLEGLASIEMFLDDAHTYPAMSFPYKTRMWKNAFMQGVMEMEQIRSANDVVKYLDDLTDDIEGDIVPITPEQLFLLDGNDDSNEFPRKQKDEHDSIGASITSWLPSILQNRFSSL